MAREAFQQFGTPCHCVSNGLVVLCDLLDQKVDQLIIKPIEDISDVENDGASVAPGCKQNDH